MPSWGLGFARIVGRVLTMCALVLVLVAIVFALDAHQSQSAARGSSLQTAVDLRPQIKQRGLVVRDQGDRLTCTVFAITFLIEYQAAGSTAEPKGLDLSEEYLNWAGNESNGRPYQDGGKFARFINAFETWGIATAQQMPYRSSFDPGSPPMPTSAVIASAKSMFPSRYPFAELKRWDNSTGLSDSQLRAVLDELRSGEPVAIGVWWPYRYTTDDVDGVPLATDYPRTQASLFMESPLFDGHSIDLVGFREDASFPGGGYFIFRNSFGPSFGDHGYGFVSFRYVRTYSTDAVAIGTMPRSIAAR
ncbi:MAG: C1 family peptidase [Candidatus Eremiobacteraeota bacterium]|nr:C1 family peptidase [Candidatus Eremiobacteraeota bacterium]MBV8365083.1 C1 family peptidase [Candidatus Eremiobacteraeota bacterium]